MSDIQKLQKVIASLEEQSTSVSEFNGVLSAVNSAKADIFSAKAAFEEMAKEQKKLLSESYTRFEEYGTKLSVLELRLKFQVQHPAPMGHRMLRWINDTSTLTVRNVA